MKVKKRYIALLCLLLVAASFLVYYNFVRFDAEKTYHSLDITKFSEKYPDFSVRYTSQPPGIGVIACEAIRIYKHYTANGTPGFFTVSYGYFQHAKDMSYKISLDHRPENTGELVARGERNGEDDAYKSQFSKNKVFWGEWGFWTPTDMSREEFNAQQIEMMDYLLSCKK
ncbi:MAG: hypothetical protein RSH79_02725 [Clostridiales bacterium]